ncbi:MAG: hypothetical protein HWD92_10470 [Flavobacteriia bacterium]|nr:hypothetical protein [Flavobacteriia bacterium]
MDWQTYIVGVVFFWAIWTIFRVLVPKKGKVGCASGDCACGPEVKKKSAFTFK